MISCSFQKTIPQFAHLWIDNPRIGLVWIGHLLIGKVSGLIVFFFQPLSSWRYYEHLWTSCTNPLLTMPLQRCLQLLVQRPLFKWRFFWFPFLPNGQLRQILNKRSFSKCFKSFWRYKKRDENGTLSANPLGTFRNSYNLPPKTRCAGVMILPSWMLLPINVSCLEFTTASISIRTVYISLYNQWQNWWTDYPEIGT